MAFVQFALLNTLSVLPFDHRYSEISRDMEIFFLKLFSELEGTWKHENAQKMSLSYKD